MGNAIEYLAMEDVAQRLSMKKWQVDRLVRRGLVAAPPRVGNRRIWFEHDLETLRAAAIRAGYIAAEETLEPV